MILWKKIMVVCPVKHTKNLYSTYHFYIIMNYLKMTDSQIKDQVVEKVNENITERVLKEQISQLQKEVENSKIIIKWYKDYVWKIFASDTKQAKLVALNQSIVEYLVPIDEVRAKTENAYLHEMLAYRWYLAMSIEEFCNDYLEKLKDKNFRNEILNDMHRQD